MNLPTLLTLIALIFTLSGEQVHAKKNVSLG